MEGKANLGFESDGIRKASTASASGQDGGFLDVDMSDVNAHTYVYQPNLSLRRMTIEALPSEENYKQNIMDMQDQR